MGIKMSKTILTIANPTNDVCTSMQVPIVVPSHALRIGLHWNKTVKMFARQFAVLTAPSRMIHFLVLWTWKICRYISRIVNFAKFKDSA